jgi:hypothetical protein
MARELAETSTSSPIRVQKGTEMKDSDAFSISVVVGLFFTLAMMIGFMIGDSYQEDICRDKLIISGVGYYDEKTGKFKERSDAKD